MLRDRYGIVGADGSGHKMAPVAAAALAATIALAACGGGSSGSKLTAAELLQKAKAVLDSSSSAHFKITGENVASSGTHLKGGSGDIARPDSMQGSFSVSVVGLTTTVKVASVGGVFEAQLPFSDHFQKANPSKLGLTDPAQMLNRETGLTRLLAVAENPRRTTSERVDGELLDNVAYQVPGADVPLLPDLDPSRPVQVTVAVNPSNLQLRSVTLVGPFTSKSSDSTYVVTLANYNQKVPITLPPAS